MKSGTEKQNKIAGILFMLAGAFEFADATLKYLRGKDIFFTLLIAVLFFGAGIIMIFKKPAPK